jgi:hypothetical protein
VANSVGEIDFYHSKDGQVPPPAPRALSSLLLCLPLALSLFSLLLCLRALLAYCTVRYLRVVRQKK